MYHYLFTNDLRISTLNTSLKEAANKILTNTVPTAAEDKSANNNINTLAFYFNLYDNNCSNVAANGNVRKVVLNFIKKFQFPNPRTFEAYSNSNVDGIKLVPMRLILKLLYMMTMCEGSQAYLTKYEIENFIFYNSIATNSFTPDLIDIYTSIKKYRETQEFPTTIDRNSANHFWNQSDRQLREMIKVLTWSGCVVENGDKIHIKHSNLTIENKSDIFEIVNYNGYWNGKYPYSDTTIEKQSIKDSYQAYMDISDVDTDILDDKMIRIDNSIGENLLIYGVPGCGKSHYIKEKYILNEQNSERVVFHPDYTYSDFVGQILPKVHSKDGGNADDNTISYDFIAGPFTRLLAKCEENDGMHYLVIEEINRGNAPAIFGEIFQLLDRTATGESEYGISNEDISSKVYGDRSQQVKIPNNLTILATMNTADQNVFTLDTAFKRRWKMKAIRNNFDDTEHKNQCTTPLCGTQLEWGKFAKAINNKIIQAAQENLGSEDKRLGIYFLKDAEMDSYEIFSEKVLMYLWNDVFKLDTTQIFQDRYKTLEDVLDDFAREDIRFKVFSSELGFEGYIVNAAEGDTDGE